MSKVTKWKAVVDTRSTTPAPDQLYQVTDIVCSNSRRPETRGLPQDTVQLIGLTDNQSYLLNVVYGYQGVDEWAQVLGIAVRKKPRIRLDPGLLVDGLEISQISRPHVVDSSLSPVNILDIFN
jgi:hypothetical protein